MPSRLPAASWTQLRPSRLSSAAFDRSCATIAAAAIALSVFIDWGCKDRAGAVLVLLMAGALVGVLMRGVQAGTPPALD